MAPPTALVSAVPAINGHLIDHKGVKHLLESTPDLRTLPPAFVLLEPTLSEPVAPLSSASAFPVINLSGLDDPKSRAGVIEAIHKACANGGFFLVVNHGIKSSLLEDMLGAAEKFFALPVEEKMKYATDEDMAPVRYGCSVNSSEPQVHHYWRDYLRHFGRPVISDSIHLWPSNPSIYQQVAKEFLEETWELAMKIAGAISEGLGKEKGYAEGIFGEGLQTISCNYYPACPQPHLALGVGPHKDQGAISILVDNHVDGLQMKLRGEWVQVPRVPGALVINLGEALETVSEGRYQGAEHRVVVNDKTARISVAVGNGPELKSFASCPPLVLRFV